MSDQPRPTVLIVEDEAELAGEYAGWLDDEYTVHTAHTGAEALDQLEAVDVDVVLLDRRLPDIPGSEVLSEVREQELDARVAMITAVDPEFDVLGMEFDDYVVKPVLRAELRSIVDTLLRVAETDELVLESFSIASKLRALSEGDRADEVEDHEEYQRLHRRLGRLREQIDETIGGLGDRELTRLYHDIDPEEESGD